MESTNEISKFSYLMAHTKRYLNGRKALLLHQHLIESESCIQYSKHRLRLASFRHHRHPYILFRNYNPHVVSQPHHPRRLVLLVVTFALHQLILKRRAQQCMLLSRVYLIV